MIRRANTVCFRVQTAGSRRGLTRIELVVVLLCVFLLLILTVPALFHQRETQRTTDCQARMQNLGLGLLRYAQDHGNRFPPLVHDGIPWTFDVVPKMENPPAAFLELDDRPLKEQPRVNLPIFLCPNGQLYETGRNCYIVNGGWGDFEMDPETRFVSEKISHTVNLDWDGDGTVTDSERERTRATGVVWRSDPADSSWGFAELDAADGRGQTFLMSETQNASSWMSTETFDLAFVVGRDAIEFGAADSLFRFRDASLGPYAINSSRGGRLGVCPAPSSLHPEGVNILFADGGFRTLSEEIEPLIYLRMMTPAGTQFGELRIRQRDAELVSNPDSADKPPILPGVGEQGQKEKSR